MKIIKNPIVNASFAFLYIVLIVSLMDFASQFLKNKPDTFFAPIGMLSLLTLSVAMMAFLFFYQPIQLFLDGKKREAFSFFTKTIRIFALLTFTVFTLLLLEII